MSYLVYYRVGKEMNLRSNVHRGTLTLTDDALIIDGEPGYRLPYRDVSYTPQYFRLHFLCRMIELTTKHEKLFFTVPLIALWRRPILTNFDKLREVMAKLDPRVRQAWIRPEMFQGSASP